MRAKFRPFLAKKIFSQTHKSFIKSLVSYDFLITTERVEESETEIPKSAIFRAARTRSILFPFAEILYTNAREYSSFKRETSLHVSSLIRSVRDRFLLKSSSVLPVYRELKRKMRTSFAFDKVAVSGTTTSKTTRRSSIRCYCSNNSASSSSNNNNNNNNEKEEFEKIKKLSNTTNDEEEKKKKKSYSYALVTKRTPPRKDLGTFRFADDQMACGVRVDLNESTFVISRVTKTYTLKYGRYVEDEKRRVEVESLERSLLNRQLGDVFKRS